MRTEDRIWGDRIASAKNSEELDAIIISMNSSQISPETVKAAYQLIGFKNVIFRLEKIESRLDSLENEVLHL